MRSRPQHVSARISEGATPTGKLSAEPSSHLCRMRYACLPGQPLWPAFIQGTCRLSSFCARRVRPEPCPCAAGNNFQTLLRHARRHAAMRNISGIRRLTQKRPSSTGSGTSSLQRGRDRCAQELANRDRLQQVAFTAGEGLQRAAAVLQAALSPSLPRRTATLTRRGRLQHSRSACCGRRRIPPAANCTIATRHAPCAMPTVAPLTIRSVDRPAPPELRHRALRMS